jgi:hypothetical protein
MWTFIKLWKYRITKKLKIAPKRRRLNYSLPNKIKIQDQEVKITPRLRWVNFKIQTQEVKIPLRTERENCPWQINGEYFPRIVAPPPPVCTAQSTYICRVQSCVWRLPNIDPPPPSPLSECVLPPHRAVRGWGGSIFWYFGRRQT